MTLFTKRFAARRLSTIAVVVVGCLAALAPASALPLSSSTALGMCRIDERSQAEVEYYKEVLASTDPLMIKTRSLHALPAVDSATVALVVADSVCATAAEAYRTQRSDDPAPARPVTVIKVGEVYVVTDPATRVGEFGLVVTMDSTFTPLVRVAH